MELEHAERATQGMPPQLPHHMSHVAHPLSSVIGGSVGMSTRGEARLRGHNPRVDNRVGADKCMVALGRIIEVHQQQTKLNSKETRVLEWHRANLEMSNGADLDKLSNDQWDQDDAYAFLGAPGCVRGFRARKPLAAGLDTLGCEVAKINHSNGVVVTDAEGNTHEADAIVVTVPLGVLKAGAIAFQPALPKRKVAAINRLGFGSLTKVMLRFDRVFWDSIDFIGFTGRTRGQFPIFIDCSRAYDKPVLLVLCTGSEADAVEAKTDKWILTQVMKILKVMYKNNVRPPQQCIVTRWRQDPWARGSYSYIPPGSSGQDYDLVATPVIGGYSDTPSKGESPSHGQGARGRPGRAEGVGVGAGAGAGAARTRTRTRTMARWSGRSRTRRS